MKETLPGNWVFADVIVKMKSCGNRLDPDPMIAVLIKKKAETQST